MKILLVGFCFLLLLVSLGCFSEKKGEQLHRDESGKYFLIDSRENEKPELKIVTEVSFDEKTDEEWGEYILQGTVNDWEYLTDDIGGGRYFLNKSDLLELKGERYHKVRFLRNNYKWALSDMGVPANVYIVAFDCAEKRISTPKYKTFFDYSEVYKSRSLEADRGIFWPEDTEKIQRGVAISPQIYWLILAENVEMHFPANLIKPLADVFCVSNSQRTTDGSSGR